MFLLARICLLLSPRGAYRVWIVMGTSSAAVIYDGFISSTEPWVRMTLYLPELPLSRSFYCYLIG